MNKDYSCLLILCVFFGLFSGCNLSPDLDEVAPLPVPKEKIAQVETLNLEEKAEPNEIPQADVEPLEKMELSLEQCRAFALENNLDLRARLIDPTIASEKVSQERARFETLLRANTGYNKIDFPNNALQDQISGTRGENSSLGLEVIQPLTTGGDVSLSLDNQREKSDRTASTYNPAYRNDLTFSISQPLLRDAGRHVNTYALSLAVTQQHIIRARTKLEVINVITAIDRAYWLLYATQRELDVRKQQYELAIVQLDQVKRLVDLGERAQVEQVRAEAGVAERLEDIIKATNSFSDYQRDLKRLMNQSDLDIETLTRLIPKTEPRPVQYDLDRSVLVDKAMANRMELLELELQLLQDQRGIQYARIQKRPKVNLSYNFGRKSIGADWWYAYRTLAEENFANHTLGFNIEIPLGNEAARSRWRQAVYERQQRLATRDSRKDVIRSEVLESVDKLDATWLRILATRQNTILAGRLYEAEKRQFDIGVRTSTDVLDAQSKLADAQSAEIGAIVEYELAISELAKATGTLLGAANVEWEPIIPSLTSDS